MSTHILSTATSAALLALAIVTSPLARTASFAADTTSTVTLRVDFGGETKEIVIELDETNAPKTSANFKKLAASGFYDGIAFHRVIPNYIVQAGDPLTKDAAQKHLWGTGGPGYTIPAEIGLPHERGSVAMARLGDAANPKKASSGSQFYIALDRLAKLDREYTVFGKVTSGLEYLDQIAASPADSNNNPSERVEIVAASVTGGVAPTLAAAKPAAPADSPEAGKTKASKKGTQKEMAAGQSAAEPDAKKKSWLKKTFGSKKDKDEEMAKADEPAPAAKPAAAPAPKAAPEPSPAAKPATAAEPAATVASADGGDSAGEPTYRNTDPSDARSAMPAQTVASGNDGGISLATEMKTRPPAEADDDDDEDDDVRVRPEKDRGLIGRFLYRYW